MACRYCNAKLFIKTVQYGKPLLAPLTKAEELRQQLQDITGEVYLELPNIYCAVCGEDLRALKERGEEK